MPVDEDTGKWVKVLERKENESQLEGRFEGVERRDIFEKERRAFSGHIQRGESESEAVLGKKACQ